VLVKEEPVEDDEEEDSEDTIEVKSCNLSLSLKPEASVDMKERFKIVHFRDLSKPLCSFVVIEATLDFLQLFLIFSLDFLEFLDTFLEELVQVDYQEHLSSEISEELGAKFRLAHAFELLSRLSQLLGLLLFSFSKGIQSIPIALFFVGDFLLLVSFVARFL